LRLSRWLEEQQDEIGARWRSRIRDRESREIREEDGFLSRFTEELVRLLPFCLGPNRAQADEAWSQSTHLFGSLALRRGLAAGEVVEEVGFLREEIFKLLMDDPPGDLRDRGLQFEMLTLSRVLDAGAVRASVAYVDDLFFAHLQGSGVPESISREVEEELINQLEAVRQDLKLRIGEEP